MATPGYLRQRENDLFLTDQVRNAIQVVYDRPLTTEAVDKINRQLRSNIPLVDESVKSQTLNAYRELVKLGKFV